MTVQQWVRDRLATAPAIYGLIAYEVLIVASSDHDPDTFSVLIVAVVSLLAFYLAHSFAETLAGNGPARLRDAIAKGFAHSAGMLYAAIIPTIVMLVCVIVRTDSDEASSWATLAGLLVLGVLGYLALAERSRPLWARLLGALCAIVLGFIIMVIDYAVH